LTSLGILPTSVLGADERENEDAATVATTVPAQPPSATTGAAFAAVLENLIGRPR
jgi:hypothetical protein